MAKNNVFPQASMGKVRGSGGLQYYDSRPHPFFSQGTSSCFDSSPRGYNQQETGRAHSAFHPRLAGEGDSQGDCSSSSSIFLQNVLCPEKEQGGETHYRSFKPQQDAYYSKVQDGEYREDLSGHSRVFVGFIGGHNRRLPSRSVTLEFPQVLRVCAGRKGVRLPEAPLRPVNRPLGLYQSDKTYKEPAPLPRGDGLQLPGRLFNSSQFSSSPVSSHRFSDLIVTGAGLRHKLDEVHSVASKEVGISGCDDGSSPAFSVSASGQNLHDFGTVQGDVGEVQGVEEGTRTPSRSPQFCGFLPSSGEALPVTTHQVDESPFIGGVSGCSEFPDPAVWGASRSVVEARVSESFCSNVLSSSDCGGDDRRFSLRVERSVITSQGGGGLEQGGGSFLNELEGVEGDPTDPAPFCGSDQREGGSGPLGQHDRLGVPETAGLCEIGSPLESLEGDFGVVSGAESPGGSGSPQGGPECPSGRRISFVSDRDGMGSGQGLVQLDLFSPGRSSGGSVRHQGQLPGEDVRLPLSGSTSSGGGRLLSGLGSLGFDLPVPSGGVSAGGSGEIESVQGSGCTGSSVLEGVQLVPPPVQEVSSGPSSSSGSFPVPGVLPGPPSSPSGGRFPASRLEAIRLGLSKQKFDERTIEVILCQHRNGTVRQYQSVWTKFLKYLDEVGVPSSEVALPDVLGFLSFHINEYHREYRTITGYKCALQFPLFVLLNLVLDCEVTWAFLRVFF